MASNNPSSSSSTPEGSATRSGQRLPEWARIANLAVGDVLSFLIFTVIGINSHHEEGVTFQHVVVTVLPFLIGWFVVSPFLGLFRREVTEKRSTMAIRTLSGWVLAWPICLALRIFFFTPERLQWTFALIALLTNLIFLLLWRVPYAWSKERKR
ncbi:DUF3054 domain-containing protein [Tengunoibacter tsumagoiensis]|uniref:DUF3054 domain-containing protein n=1 Tax=Tengunoibacter tsumagoiensis TaxID=2014871 RepID=A0A402A5J2_9CHLR|nr:DUF3054 domain-containing protein [Tengunoibacter tsumagoiensis]GCE14370.1 hypothetical protein KTT_42290 [Tengunoibacter tsumagoiensis]